jgi:hypothetical protein
VRVCRHLSKETKDIPSVNSYIEKKDFPTCFDSAAKMATIVRTHSHLPSAHMPFFLGHIPDFP